MGIESSLKDVATGSSATISTIDPEVWSPYLPTWKAILKPLDDDFDNPRISANLAHGFQNRLQQRLAGLSSAYCTEQILPCLDAVVQLIYTVCSRDCQVGWKLVDESIDALETYSFHGLDNLLSSVLTEANSIATSFGSSAGSALLTGSARIVQAFAMHGKKEDLHSVLEKWINAGKSVACYQRHDPRVDAGYQFFTASAPLIIRFLEDGLDTLLDPVLDATRVLADKSPVPGAGGAYFIPNAYKEIARYMGHSYGSEWKSAEFSTRGIDDVLRQINLFAQKHGVAMATHFLPYGLYALQRSVDLAAFASVYPHLWKANSFCHDPDDLKEIFHSDFHEDAIVDAVAASQALDTLYRFDRGGHPSGSDGWRASARKILEETVRNRYGIGSVSDLSLTHLSLVATLDTGDAFLSSHQSDTEKVFPYNHLNKAVAAILEGKVQKSFPLNRTYLTKTVTGPIDASIDPAHAVELFLYGVLGSRNHDNVEAASAFFQGQRELLEAAWQYLKTSGKLPKRIAVEKRELIRKVQQGNPDAAQELLHYFKETVCAQGRPSRTEPLRKLVELVESISQGRRFYDTLVYKSQTGTVRDLFNNREVQACTFHPTGYRKHAAALYVLDPDVVLLPLVPQCGQREYDSLAVAIGFLAREKKHDEKILVVDSVEAGMEAPKTWKEDYLAVTSAFAREEDCVGVQYNTNLFPGSSMCFTQFLRQRGLSSASLAVTKLSGTDVIQEYGATRLFLECFGEWEHGIFDGWKKPEGIVQGYFLPIEK